MANANEIAQIIELTAVRVHTLSPCLRSLPQYNYIATALQYTTAVVQHESLTVATLRCRDLHTVWILLHV